MKRIWWLSLLAFWTSPALAQGIASPTAFGARSVILITMRTDGPLTPWANAFGRTDENGYLRMSLGTPGVTDGTLTPMANLRVRTDENGYLRVSLAPTVVCANLTLTGDVTSSASCATTLAATQTNIRTITGGSQNYIQLGPAGGNVPSDQSINGHLIRSNVAGNVVTLQEMQNAGYSAMRFVDDGGLEHGAIGYGNTGSGAYASQVFLESSLVSTTAWMPFKIRRTQLGVGSAVALDFQSTGNIVATWNDPTGGTSPPRMTIATGGVTLSGLFTAQNDSSVASFTSSVAGGTNVIKNDLTITDAANTGGHLILFDNNAGIWGREGGVDVVNYYSFGGTGAKGHRFFTGGVKASQTLKLQIANDFVTSSIPLAGSGTGTSVANVGANSCGTTAATIAGNQISGVITVGATSGTQCRVTFSTAAPNARDCTSNDDTTTVAVRTTPIDVSNTDFIGAFTAGDKVTYTCFVR